MSESRYRRVAFLLGWEGFAAELEEDSPLGY